MTPAARIAAAIDILDTVRTGQPAEQALTNWARRHRFAGSGDRAAIRDTVFDALRRRRSALWASGAGEETGRALMIGSLTLQNIPLEQIFCEARFAPPPLSAEEHAALAAADPAGAPDPVRLDYPDWLDTPLREGLGDRLGPVMTAQSTRAPIFLRVNLLKTTRDAALRRLAEEGIAVTPHPEVATALTVEGSGRGLRQAPAFADGWVELQDAASQATALFAAEAAPRGKRPPKCLDYCAGGGGKTLALAAALDTPVAAHDADAGRMSDLPARARRSGADVTLLKPGEPARQAPWDLVLVDAPCSGSGAWRRQAEARWQLSPARLAELTVLQATILDEAAALVEEGGALVYVTCSILGEENESQVSAFLARHPGWRSVTARRWWPGSLGDGFFAAHLIR